MNSGVTSEITLSGFDKHFVGADNGIIVSGAKSLSEKAIKFQMPELDSKRSVFFWVVITALMDSMVVGRLIFMERLIAGRQGESIIEQYWVLLFV
ncbi:hypothetical protein [Pseudoalteromonas piscicida]|uniref:Uncharacterized protein n=1 Tax=Pseudoalteromonas piscicida TaxID=43662 RepID=A0AAD0W3E4_PSEO7|nr:hypothetical protein [Pseudoalteromonas piscicida]ASD67835.1 hypothetical protein B1L02_12945 [Pseudoalteromonas piscicida]AXR01461.1 hypothetical protein D0511_04785 [Pseudoalteromonas piscicida]